MKKLMFLLGILSFPLLGDFVELAQHYYPNSTIVDKIWTISLIPRYGTTDFLAKNCTKDVSKNGHGWIFVRRDFYSCGKLSIFLSDLLFTEYTQPRDLKKEKQACAGCKL